MTAVAKRKKVEIVWRGFKDVVEPSEPEFTTSELRRRLVKALQEILKINKTKTFSEKEEKVWL